VDYILFYGKGNANYRLVYRTFVHHRIISAVHRAEFVNDSMSYIVLRGRWCNIIVLNDVYQLRRKVLIQRQFCEEMEHGKKAY
jgi:hypothetical protein